MVEEIQPEVIEAAEEPEPEVPEPVAEPKPKVKEAKPKKPTAKKEVKKKKEPAVKTDDIKITDAARKLAEGAGIDLAKVKGTGKGGNILKSDIEKLIKE